MIRRFARDAGLACVAAAAVAGASRLVPTAGPVASDAQVRAAMEEVLRNAAAAAGRPDAGPVQMRVYDVRDLLEWPVAYSAMLGEVDGPGGFVLKPVGVGILWGKSSVRDRAALELKGLLDVFDPPPPVVAGAVPSLEWGVGGRLLLIRTAAGHARVEKWLEVLRSAERARRAWGAR